MTNLNPAIEDFQPLRRCLAPQYAALPSPQLVALMDSRFGEGAAYAYNDYLEGFFDDLVRGAGKAVNQIGNVVRQAAPIVANVGSGVLAGGSAMAAGGPIAMIAGGVLGGAGKALGSYAPGPWRDVGNVLNTGVQIAGQFTPQGRLGAQLGGFVGGLPGALRSPQAFLQQAPGLIGAFSPQAGAAAQRLSSLFQTPTVRQAMGALQLGDLGRSSVPVGAAQLPVPVSAITSLLSRLSAQAVDEALQNGDAGEADPSYMFDSLGRPIGDATSEIDRHNRLLSLLDQAQQERRLAELQALLLAQQQQLAQRSNSQPASRRTVAAAWSQPSTEDWGEDWNEDFGEDFGETLDEASLALDVGDVSDEADAELLDESMDEWAGGTWAYRGSREMDHVHA